MKYIVLYVFSLLFCLAGHAQNELELLRQGNKQFLSKEYEEAELSYQEALETNSNYTYAMFNLGVTFFVKEDYEKSRDQFENAALSTDSKLEKSQAYYNLASSYVMTAMEIAKEAQENPASAEQGVDPYTFLEKGADALKESLRNEPRDEDARYNLAFLQKLMKMHPPQENQDNEGEDGDDGDDENQDKGDEGDKGDEKKEEKDNEGDEEKDEENQDEPKDKKPEPRELSKEDAQRILDAIDRKEKDIREKMNLKKAKGEKSPLKKIGSTRKTKFLSMAFDTQII